ncbi:polysaccharide deacetylase family protein [Plantactinospora siamensis]|uniref:Polysaccharide deacetylase family protein n=1 Tax=Plantactinospora siamensis TaxID=555372 RepID=A0ABV6NU98_9ACTN
MHLDRRNALRAAAAVALGLTASCDSPRTSPGTAVAPTGQAAAPSPPAGVPSAIASQRDWPVEIANGPRDRPNVALTFHGQGDPALARQLLAELERGGATVTVFAVGSWLADQAAMARRILDGGHELGNHTENHRNIAGMDPSAAFREINDCAQRLRRLTGSVGQWFRPSQTRHATAMIHAQAARVGYPTCVSYDVDSLDYTDPGHAAVTRSVLRDTRAGSIVSLHFGHPGTLAAIGPILDGLRQRRLRPVTMKELTA